jgi:hypothetical protein
LNAVEIEEAITQLAEQTFDPVPNILKVLNPLFLDDLRAKLEAAGNNPRTLLNLRKRLAKIRVFDPACGSGNFLVIAYKKMRLASRDKGANQMAEQAHQMREMNIGIKQTVVLPCVSSENRDYLPIGLIDNKSTITNLCFGLFDAPLWNMAIIASRIHLIWIATVCGKLETRYRYSNTLGWNTFPVPKLTEKNKADLTRCAEDILLAREAHFPATIAELYDPAKMPDDLRRAHEKNDEVLERIYIGRRFKNDTERLEKLFDLYTEMTTSSKEPA